MKIFLKSAVLSALAFSSVIAATDYDYNGYEVAPNQYGSEYEQLPAAGCESECAVDIFADLLCWKAHQAGLEYAFRSTDNRINVGADKAPHFDWDCGFRLGVGKNLPYNGANLSLAWTHFNADAKGNLTVPAGGTLQEILASPVLNQFLEAASSHFKLNLDFIDLQLSKEFSFCDFFILKPHVGLRAEWLQEHHHVNYSLQNPIFGNPDVLRFKNNFWGVGLRTGLETQWGFGYGLSLCVDGAFSLIPGYYSLSVSENISPSQFLLSYNKDNYWIAKAIADGCVGIKWDTWLCGQYHAAFLIGWEQQFFFNQWQWQSAILPPGPHGDLALSGLTVRAKFDF